MSDLQAQLSRDLTEAGLPNAGREAERIVAAAQRQGRGWVQIARDMVARRLQGEPLAYLTGVEEFMGVTLMAAPGALAPRAETETLGYAALAALQRCDQDRPRLIDMCCGSGNLACALAQRMPGIQVWACDLTDACVGLTRRNVEQLGLQQRVQVVQGDLFSGLDAPSLHGTVDVIVCNPPYISRSKLSDASASLLLHEPREAFDGGPYGLSIHQRVIREAQKFLRPDGVLLFELGLGQDKQVRQLFERSKSFFELQTYQNDAAQVRAISARMRAPSNDNHDRPL